MRTHRTLSTLITTLALAAALAAPASAASHTSAETPATAEAAIPGFPAGDPTLFNGRERNIAFRAAFAMENSDPATAFAGMMLLADAGYARAIDRIARRKRAN